MKGGERSAADRVRNPITGTVEAKGRKKRRPGEKNKRRPAAEAVQSRPWGSSRQLRMRGGTVGWILGDLLLSTRKRLERGELWRNMPGGIPEREVNHESLKRERGGSRRHRGRSSATIGKVGVEERGE